jgi:integrator complex subunit 10
MFQYIGVEVQQKILLLTANNNSDNSLDHCRLILLLLKRFPQAIPTHAPRLLETLIQGMTTSPKQFREILVLEALPLIFQKPPENLSTGLVNRIMAICFEYYIKQMMEVSALLLCR